MLSSALSQFVASTRMTKSEVIFLVVALLCIFAYCTILFKSWRTGLILSLLSLPALFLALAFTGQFLMLDAIKKMEETTEMSYSALDSWRDAGYRTTYVFFALMMRYRSLIAPQLPHLSLQILVKLMHWLFGFVVLGWIHFLLDRHFIDKGNRNVFFLLYLYTALLLPANATALKFYNYDLFSLVFAVIAILYIALALKCHDYRYALASIATATLAAQEKAVSAPVLILSLAVLPYIRLKQYPHSRKLEYMFSLAGWTSMGFIIVFGIGAVSYLLVAIIRTEPMPIGLVPSFLGPAVSLNRLLFHFVFGVANQDTLLIHLQYIAFNVLGISIAAGAMLWIEKVSKKQTLVRFPMLLYYAVLGLSSLVVLVGVAVTLTLTVYEAPTHPIPAGYYVPGIQFNDVTEHFGARTFLGHLLAQIGAGYSDFVTSIPTVYWIIFAVSLITSFKLRDSDKLITYNMLLLIGLLMPMGFILARIGLNPRYMNIPLFVLALGIDLYLVESVTHLSVPKQYLATSGVIILLLVELLPFSPVLGPFRPVWDWGQYHPYEIPESGVLSGSWQSYGVEVAVVANMLEYYCLHPQANDIANQIDCGSFTLYFHFPGRWLKESPMLDTAQTGLTRRSEINPEDLLLYSRRDVPRDILLPTTVEPLMRVEYMGLVDAWVFSVDALDKAGVDHPG